MQLWLDMPQYQSPKSKRNSPEYEKIQRQERCINLTSKGGFSHACKALVHLPLVIQLRSLLVLLKSTLVLRVLLI